LLHRFRSARNLVDRAALRFNNLPKRRPTIFPRVHFPESYPSPDAETPREIRIDFAGQLSGVIVKATETRRDANRYAQAMPAF